MCQFQENSWLLGRLCLPAPFRSVLWTPWCSRTRMDEGDAARKIYHRGRRDAAGNSPRICFALHHLASESRNCHLSGLRDTGQWNKVIEACFHIFRLNGTNPLNVSSPKVSSNSYVKKAKLLFNCRKRPNWIESWNVVLFPLRLNEMKCIIRASLSLWACLLCNVG